VVVVTAADGVRPRLEDVVRAVHEPLVRALAFAARDWDTAADCVQDAYVKAHLHWDRVSRYDDPAAWIRRVAWNCLIDKMRRGRVLDRVRTKLAAGARQGDDELDIDMADAIARLPLRQRSVVALFYIGGFPIHDIAATLRISEGTVKSQLHDARNRLRATLTDED
jgi:RNA polymerase sigma-70 factor (ECF subfamily)